MNFNTLQSGVPWAVSPNIWSYAVVLISVVVTKLKNVFMKIEDNSGAYRPLIYETETWPLPLANCACPYDPPRGSDRPRVAQPSRATGARLTQELPASLPAASAPTAGPTAAAAVVKKRPGYCECCALRYEDLKMVRQLLEKKL